MTDLPEPPGGEPKADELVRLHDELDLLAPSRGAMARTRDVVVIGAAAYASWMIMGTASALGLAWPLGIALGVGWSVSLGITVARRLRIRELRRRIVAVETGDFDSGDLAPDQSS